MSQDSRPQYRVVVDKDVPARMRDGVTLYADVYRPDAPGRFPVLLSRLPYNKNLRPRPGDIDYFVERGYIVIMQDTRGRFTSEGEEYYPLIWEMHDGYDAVEWAATLPWSDGNIGTMGQSYLGATQYLLAPSRPPHLKAVFPVSAAADFHQCWVYHTGGAFELGWPLARTRYTPYYLHSQGHANSRHGDGQLTPVVPGDEPADRFVYSPDDPVPTRGGNTLIIPMGVQDQRPVEERQDVLVYTSEPLATALEVTGPITLQLFVATDVVDTDFTAKLVDVRPDDYAQNLADGILRTRYRESRLRPTLLTPGQVYQLTIDLWATSHVFLPGHRLRLHISSSNFPRFDRNLNTGEDQATGTRWQPALQTIFHNQRYPSHIVLPVIPR